MTRIVHLRYRAPWLPRRDALHDPTAYAEADDANVWNYDHEAQQVLAIVRLTDVASLVPVAVPVSRTRRAGRFIVSPHGDGTTWAIEPFEHERLPRVRLLLYGAPFDVSIALSNMG